MGWKGRWNGVEIMWCIWWWDGQHLPLTPLCLLVPLGLLHFTVVPYNHLGSFSKSQCPGCTPDQWKQNFWGWDPDTSILSASQAVLLHSQGGEPLLHFAVPWTWRKYCHLLTAGNYYAWKQANNSSDCPPFWILSSGYCFNHFYHIRVWFLAIKGSCW